MVGELSEQEVEKLEQILYRPQDYGVPIRMLNRQKDIFTGNDLHYIGSDLGFVVFVGSKTVTLAPLCKCK